MLVKIKLKIELSVFAGLIIVVIISVVALEQGFIFEKISTLILILSIFCTFIIGNYLTTRYERKKLFWQQIESSLYELGFNLIEERPLTVYEIFKYLDLTPKLTIFVNDIPIGRFGYKTKNYRMLKVKHRFDGLFWLFVETTTTLKNKTILKVKKQINLSDIID